MSVSDLAARLTAHEHAFESLLDLIPAKFYNPEDAANQWNKRKQTKEEAAKAKRAKLDPDQMSRKKGTIDEKAHDEEDSSKISPGLTKNYDGNAKSSSGDSPQKNVKQKKGHHAKESTASSKSPRNKSESKALDTNDVHNADAFATHETGDTSIGNIQGALADPGRNITDLRAKLAAKIEALRSKRKAPGSGVDGAPTSRDAILEARRRKEDVRKEKKKLEKEARKDAAQEIESEDDESPKHASADDDESSDGDEDQVDGLAYGKVAFSNGEHLDADGTLKTSRKRKQQDTQSALQAALNKKARLAALPVEKQAKIADSDSWHRALLQADGEKVKDDMTLLKKAAKRKESIKKKSTKEWKERLSSIAKSKALKQKNREQNLKDRRESKGKAGGHKKGKQIGAYQGKKGGSKGKAGGF